MAREKYEHLKFTVRALAAVNMWPVKKEKGNSTVKQYYLIVVITLTTFPILADFITQFYGKFIVMLIKRFWKV